MNIFLFMRYNSILLAICAPVLLLSCGGKNEKTGSVVIDSVPKAVFNIQPEYFFSGILVNENDSSFLLKESVTGNSLNIEKNRIFEKLIGKYDSISQSGLLMNVDVRGYLKNKIENNDTTSLLYITYIEDFVGTKSADKNSIVGSYSRDGAKLEIYDDHTCVVSDSAKRSKGEWFMSNDTLLYVKLGDNSCVYDVDWNNHSLYSHNDRNSVLNKK